MESLTLAFLEEIRSGDYGAVKAALESGRTNTNESDDSGYTLLHWAAGNQQEDIVALLLAHGANANVIWERESFSGCELVRPVDLAEEDDLQDRLHRAAVLQGEEAAKRGDRDSSRISDLSLLSAAALGDIPAAETALKAGADVDQDLYGFGYGAFSSCCPLGEAIQSGSLDMVRFLGEHGTNIDMDLGGPTSLHIAAMCGAGVDMVRLLLELGADPLKTDNEDWLPSKNVQGSSRTDPDYLSIVDVLCHAACSAVCSRKQRLRGSIMQQVAHQCAEHGHVRGLAMLAPELDIEPAVLKTAAVYGQPEALKWCLLHGVRGDVQSGCRSHHVSQGLTGRCYMSPTIDEVRQCLEMLRAWQRGDPLPDVRPPSGARMTGLGAELIEMHDLVKEVVLTLKSMDC